MFIGRGHACVSDLASEHGMKDRKRIAHARHVGRRRREHEHLVSRFRSSHHYAARSFANFGIEGH